jgi:subtilisin family serine protease
VTSIILGFRCDPARFPGLPPVFDGVAPGATIIPINDNPDDHAAGWSSTGTHSVVYVTNLKRSGALGGSPVVINMSQGGFTPDVIERAAIDYAVANGIIFVAGAGNEADAGMRYPGAYPLVISAAATGWVDAFPPDDASTFEWVIRDFPESDARKHFVAPFSSWQLPGQDLDVAAPGWAIPGPWANQNGQTDYSFFFGTSAATPHVAGLVALMLQKNPTLTPGQVEAILESTAAPLPPACRAFVLPAVGPGNGATWGDHSNVSMIPLTFCWPANATGAGLIRADAALAATPLP